MESLRFDVVEVAAGMTEEIEEAASALRSTSVQTGLTSMEYYGFVEAGWKVRVGHDEHETPLAIDVAYTLTDSGNAEFVRANLEHAAAPWVESGVLHEAI